MDILVRDGKAYEFEAFALDPVRRTLIRDAKPVALSATVFETLLYLVEHPGRVVTKDELLDAVWPRKVVEEANVSQTIYTLRRALAAAGASERLIATMPGQGYQFTAPVQIRDAKTAGVAAAASITIEDNTGQPRARRPRRWPLVVGLCILVAAGLTFGLWRWRETQAPAAPGVVVLGGFQNLTRDPVFDRTLARALEIDLDQSPSITALSERQVQDTLELMMRPRDTPLTAALASEVCVRNNGVAVVDGAIGALGAKYLLTLNATDCASGRALAAEKAEVAGRDAVIPALDRMIAKMREKLGEPSASIARFNVPLANEKTASLDAIKAFSEASHLTSLGRSAEAATLYQHAIALDPNFAAAYVGLASLQFNSRQTEAAKASMVRAYALRGTVNEELRLNIEILYASLVSNDYDAVIRSARAMTDLYPRQASAWINLSNAENWLGYFAPAVEAGRHAVEAAPRREQAYVVLARALMHAGRLDESAKALDDARAKGLAGAQTAVLGLELDIARGDVAAQTRALAEARGKPFEDEVLAVAARDAYRRGQIAHGDEIYERIAGLSSQAGEADTSLADHASDLAALGLTDRARALLAKAAPDVDPFTYLVTLAETGEAAKVRVALREDQRRAPEDTLLNAEIAPEVRAILALRAGRPQEAEAIFGVGLPYEARDNDAAYQIGLTFLAANDGAHAVRAFQDILARPGVEPADVQRPLARLGLARGLRMTHDISGARQAYNQFLGEWRNADPGLPPLHAAHAELAALRP